MRVMVSVICLGLFLFLSTNLDAQSGKNDVKSNQPMIVNIDNPNFRKLVMAIPSFIVSNEKGSLGNYSARGSKELSELLAFSGLFSIISESAYTDVMAKVAELQKKNSSVRGLDGIDLSQWKALGIESLTIGNMDQDGSGYNIELRTIDINRGEVLLGKRYSKVKESEFTNVMRRYADLVLQAYTGKPGIFSSKLVFVGRKTKGSAKQIYISDFDGSNPVAITKGNMPHLSPSWSNDGKYVLFTSYQEGNPDLFIHEVSTGKQRKLSGKRGINSGGAFAPGDEIIAFTGSVEGNADIYLVKPSGGDRRLFIAGSGLDVDPAWSPDKKSLAFVSGRYGNPHIFRADLKWLSPTDVKVVGEQRLTFAGWYNAVPSWSPDSDKIMFAGLDKDINRFDIFIMDPDGKNMERLTLRTGDNESPSWSPNGQMIAFHSNRTNGTNVKSVAQLYVMNRDGSAQRMLNTGLYEAQTPKWSSPLQ